MQKNAIVLCAFLFVIVRLDRTIHVFEKMDSPIKSGNDGLEELPLKMI